MTVKDDRLTANAGLLAHSAWDAIPVLAGIGHFAFLLAMLVFFDRLPWWAMIAGGAISTYLIAWNINGVSHNFIHNPYFNSRLLNRLYSLMLSLSCGFSQVMYDWVHIRHHIGNMDRLGPDGTTIDPISIYLHGRNGQPENPWSYALKSFLRDDPVAIYRAIREKDPAGARFAVFELVTVLVVYAIVAVINWRFVLFMAPFYYLGHTMSALVGYYEHYRSDPDRPIAWGVSSYNRFYNWLWFNNGYHAEHHFRPRMHWTQMKRFHKEIAERQREAGVRVIRWPHHLGFLERD